MLVPGRFSSAAINIGDGELEVRLSDGGNWQVKVKMGEEWRLLCRGHIDGTIFETSAADAEEPITVGPLRVDPAARRVEVNGAPVRLTAREYELVALLATDPARVFTMEELLREVWRDKGGGSVRTVNSHASRARVKLREAGAEGFIVNCHAHGYRLCVE